MRKRCYPTVSVFLIIGLLIGDMWSPMPLKAQSAGNVLQDIAAMQVDNSVTVTTSDEFIAALSQGKSPITVDGVITIGDEADASGRMLPVMIPADTVILGTVGSGICSRSPVQLMGDNVTIKDIEWVFNSTNALGSVPHREIFLAGHSLKMDNVSTYLEGGDNSLGMIGGTEEELLPSVYAGGYPGTVVGDNASLTILNSNSKTMLKGIYLSHGAENDEKVSYESKAVLKLDTEVTVREGIYTSLNTAAEITVTGVDNTKSAKAVEYYGNANTTLTVVRCSMYDAVISQVGHLILDEEALMSPQTDSFLDVTIKNGACLDLKQISEATIQGNLIGAAQNSGILVLDSEGLLTIDGTVSGVTTLQTGSKQFPGTIYAGNRYIKANWAEETEYPFVLAENYTDDGFFLYYSQDGWWVDCDSSITEIPKIGKVEILSVPNRIDLADITGNYGTIPDTSVYMEMKWYDEEGNAFSQEDLDYFQFEAYNRVIIKTDYYNSSDEEILAKTDWGNGISLETMMETPGCYYFRAEADPAANVRTGNYTFLFLEDEVPDLSEATVKEIQSLKEMVKAQCQIEFYDSEKGVLPSGSESPVKSPSSAPSVGPSVSPSSAPSVGPSVSPSSVPSAGPNISPSSAPSAGPNISPSNEPSSSPSVTPDVSTQPTADTEPENSATPLQSQNPIESELPPESIAPAGSATPKVSLLPVQSVKPQQSFPPEESPTVPENSPLQEQTKTFIPKSVPIKKAVLTPKGILLEWKKGNSQIQGYVIEYSISSKFAKKNTKVVVVKNRNTTSKRIRIKKAKQKYYIHICTYQEAVQDGRKSKIYSKWSKKKVIKKK